MAFGEEDVDASVAVHLVLFLVILDAARHGVIDLDNQAAVAALPTQVRGDVLLGLGLPLPPHHRGLGEDGMQDRGFLMGTGAEGDAIPHQDGQEFGVGGVRCIHGSRHSCPLLRAICTPSSAPTPSTSTSVARPAAKSQPSSVR